MKETIEVGRMMIEKQVSISQTARIQRANQNVAQGKDGINFSWRAEAKPQGLEGTFLRRSWTARPRAHQLVVCFPVIRVYPGRLVRTMSRSHFGLLKVSRDTIRVDKESPVQLNNIRVAWSFSTAFSIK